VVGDEALMVELSAKFTRFDRKSSPGHEEATEFHHGVSLPNYKFEHLENVKLQDMKEAIKFHRGVSLPNYQFQHLENVKLHRCEQITLATLKFHKDSKG